MGIKLLFKISKEFFDSIHSPYIDDEEDLQILPDEENEFIIYKEFDNDNEDYCNCILCYIVRRIILFINPKIFKSKLN